MLDETVSGTTDKVIWGIPVPLMTNGNRKWPEAIKVMAEERIAAGAKPRAIAAELGALETQVRKWLRRGQTRVSDCPGFVEAQIVDTPMPTVIVPSPALVAPMSVQPVT